MLLWLVFCSEIMLALEDVYGDWWFSLRDHQNMEVCWVMLSLAFLDVLGTSRKPNVNTTNKCVWDMGGRNVFEAVASGGAGVLLFTMNLAQHVF